MVNITFELKSGEDSFYDDFEAAIYQSAEKAVKENILERLKTVEGIDSDAITITIDLKSGEIEIGNIANEELRAKIIAALK